MTYQITVTVSDDQYHPEGILLGIQDACEPWDAIIEVEHVEDEEGLPSLFELKKGMQALQDKDEQP